MAITDLIGKRALFEFAKRHPGAVTQDRLIAAGESLLAGIQALQEIAWMVADVELVEDDAREEEDEASYMRFAGVETARKWQEKARALLLG
jgi:hypothetical protein